MFCSHCGKEVAAGAKFCANCGAAVNSQPTPAAEPPKAPAPTAQREVPAVEQVGGPSGNVTGSGGQPEKKKKGVPKKPLIIVAAVLVLIVGFGAILSLFGDGSEPDSDSKGSNGLDWVEKIPYIPGEVPLIGTTALEDELSCMNKTSYEKLKELGNRGFESLGIPNHADFGYYVLASEEQGSGNILVHSQQKIVSMVTFFEPGSLDVASIPTVSSVEPLIAKNQIDIYYLFYKRDNCYMVEVALPDDPTSSYLAWPVLYGITIMDTEYSGLLTGDIDLEIVSIPGEDGTTPNTPTIVDTPTPSQTDWVNQIPLIPGYSDLYYFENEGVQAHKRPHDFAPGGVEDFIGLSDSEQVNYSTADIDGGTVCFGQGPDRIVSYAEVYDKPLESISTYYIVSETEPVIGKRNDGYCFLFYKRDYDDGGMDSHSYEIYMVQQTDSPNYEDWLFRAYIYVNAPEFYDYLNGTKELEIISVPGQSTQVVTEPTATTPEPSADSNKTSNNRTTGTVDTSALPENGGAQYVSKLEEYVADPAGLDLTLGRESDYTSLSLGHQRNMLDYPQDYIGTKAIFPWPLKVLSSGETQNGYRYYAVNEMDNSIAEEDKVDVVLIDVRENASEDVKAIGDEFKSYLVFAGGVHTDEGWYIVFFVTADI